MVALDEQVTQQGDWLAVYVAKQIAVQGREHECMAVAIAEQVAFNK